jgi:hypothetical protein
VGATCLGEPNPVDAEKPKNSNNRKTKKKPELNKCRRTTRFANLEDILVIPLRQEGAEQIEPVG